MTEIKLEDLIQDEEVLKQLQEAKTDEEFKALFEAHTGKKLVHDGIIELSDEELDSIGGAGVCQVLCGKSGTTVRTLLC